jgi:hypothetical protein
MIYLARVSVAEIPSLEKSRMALIVWNSGTGSAFFEARFGQASHCVEFVGGVQVAVVAGSGCGRGGQSLSY